MVALANIFVSPRNHIFKTYLVGLRAKRTGSVFSGTSMLFVVMVFCFSSSRQRLPLPLSAKSILPLVADNERVRRQASNERRRGSAQSHRARRAALLREGRAKRSLGLRRPIKNTYSN